jgi:hypothetical protein
MSFRCRACLALVLPLLSLPFPSIAEDDSRPACNSHNQGSMWPEAANHDRSLISRLVRCGELLICVRGNWRYHWEAASVRLDQLDRRTKTKVSKPSFCEVSPGTGEISQGEITQQDRSGSGEKIE